MAISGSIAAARTDLNDCGCKPTKKREAAAEELQAVFTAVLNEAGQSGYASADSLPESLQLPDASPALGSSGLAKFVRCNIQLRLAPVVRVCKLIKALRKLAEIIRRSC